MTSHVPRIKTTLSLQANRKVLGLLEGEYVSVATGRGMDFNDLREYVRGDDVKDLDWKASARTGGMLVRRYVAMRKHTVQLVMSTGRTMAAANAIGVSKRTLAVEVAGILGWLAVRQGDHVAATYGDEAGQHALPARGGELHLERCLAACHDRITPTAAPADLAGVLRHVARTVRRRTILVLVCDEEEVSPDVTRALRRLVVQHQVLMVTVGDVDPVGAPASAGRPFDLGVGRRLPEWARGDGELVEALRAARAAALADLHATVTGLGVVHEHLAEGDSALVTVQRLLARNRYARRR